MASKSSSNNNEGTNENTTEENLTKSPSNNNEGKNENTSEEKNSNSRSFLCNYCRSKFSTQQALAGHQNAHRAERAFEKQRKERYDGETSGLGLVQHQFNPSFNYSSSLFTPCTYRPLGVRMESMIQKSHFDSPVTGHGALRLQDMLNPSLASFRNNIEFRGTRGVGVQGIDGATTSRIEDGPNNQIHDFLKLVDSSTNVATSSNVEEEPSNPESSELDLTLKL
ncbi:hypothetical protein TSUD_172380 [Trifolium subterraneum]|uniref:C2H2-type domain-containing protein n=1 Tax=Trifolium subterraneum TaxID=3900 RepID=A0A2Z6MIR9_TRISU|nr:hypothetical protein TSUD_172380 [Trifolium subterraneum]